MGHIISHLTFDGNTAKEEIIAEANEWYAANHDWQEDPNDTLPYDIRFIRSTVANTYDEAMDYIEQHDNGWYDQLAVKYQEPKALPKKIEKLLERSEKLDKDANDLLFKPYFTNHKAQYITCPHCGSKIARKYLTGNRCPVCSHNMVPESVQNKSLDMQNKAEELKEQYNKEKADWVKNNAKKCNTKWLVKLECHC